jgi:copper chaperone CopZ
MLCHRCLMKAAKAVSFIEGIQEINMDLEKKLIKITYNNKNTSRYEIENIINEAITGEKSISL